MCPTPGDAGSSLNEKDLFGFTPLELASKSLSISEDKLAKLQKLEPVKSGKSVKCSIYAPDHATAQVPTSYPADGNLGEHIVSKTSGKATVGYSMPNSNSLNSLVQQGGDTSDSSGSGPLGESYSHMRKRKYTKKRPETNEIPHWTSPVAVPVFSGMDKTTIVSDGQKKMLAPTFNVQPSITPSKVSHRPRHPESGSLSHQQRLHHSVHQPQDQSHAASHGSVVQSTIKEDTKSDYNGEQSGHSHHLPPKAASIPRIPDRDTNSPKIGPDVYKQHYQMNTSTVATTPSPITSTGHSFLTSSQSTTSPTFWATSSASARI